jgi:hypothetical protein
MTVDEAVQKARALLDGPTRAGHPLPRGPEGQALYDEVDLLGMACDDPAAFWRLMADALVDVYPYPMTDALGLEKPKAPGSAAA